MLPLASHLVRCIFTLVLVTTTALCAQNKSVVQSMPAIDLLEKSVAYHDPNNRWANLKAKVMIQMQTPNSPDRLSEIQWNHPQEFFSLTTTKGPHIEPKAYLKEFMGATYWALKVSYDPTVGKDTWYFYIDPQTFQMRHYQFFHDEQLGDGEYILLSGEVQVSGIKMPKDRAWYTNIDQKYLGTDYLKVLK